MAGAADLAKMVPGFDFLQSLMKGAGAALPGIPGLPSVAGIPGMGQWIAPTLDPEELEKRIQELKTVQFWLEQNARLLATTIQALEVQRMTLSTLKTMNLPMAELREALKIKTPAAKAAPAAADASQADEEAEDETEEDGAAEATPSASSSRRKSASSASKAAGGAPAVDPLQWWGALTQQFTEIATKAVKDSTADAARNLAGAAVKQSVAAAGSTLKKAASLPVKVARKAAATAATATRGAGTPARKRSR